MAYMNNYLGIERLIVDVLKEVVFVALVFFLAYRILFEVPLEGPFDEWCRLILLGIGYAMIPGWCIKMYVFLTPKTMKDK